MSANTSQTDASPWRRIFEEVRQEVGNKRDKSGVLGSINWLRKQMEQKGANPNVVRNIIYRDKGKLSDKRALFEIIKKLWEEHASTPLQAPELEVLLSSGTSAEQEVMQLLGREKRRAYRSFVGGVRAGEHPNLIITGRPGSGKTLLLDYAQQALEMPPRAAERIVRLEFSSSDLAASLSRLASELNVPHDLFEAKLVKIGLSSAFAVQADAQADVCRVMLDAVRNDSEPLVLLLHVSQSLEGEDHLGSAPLRLNTPDVPRVTTSEWLWSSLFEPLSRMAHVSLLISMMDLPARALSNMGAFEAPIKLSPPTMSEARRFIKTRLPHLPPGQQESLLQRSGRSFEELRTLTLLAETREPFTQGNDNESSKHVEQLSQLIEVAGDHRLRDFLAALAVLSIPEFPVFHANALQALRNDQPLSSLESSFLDPAPGQENHYRCFSRKLSRSLRAKLELSQLGRYRKLNEVAAAYYHEEAMLEPASEQAARYLHHLFEARDWESLSHWLRHHSVQQSLMRRIWQAAEQELDDGALFEAIAFAVASHYVKLGSYKHPDTERAFGVLTASGNAKVRAWTTLKRAEGAVLKGQFERAESLLSGWPNIDDATLNADYELVRANIARWRSQLDLAAGLVDTQARSLLPDIPTDDSAGRLVHAKVAVWSGLIAKDKGDLSKALEIFSDIHPDDELIEARVSFQKGDLKMKLGSFDAALKDLNEAVRLSHRSEALVQEQTRYLARRGTLYRKQRELAHAQHDFEAALTILQNDDTLIPDLEKTFWLAKVNDERALCLLAAGHFDEAIFALQRNNEVFKNYQTENEVDASYRILRSTLRLAISYAYRGMAQAYTLPNLRTVDDAPGQADVKHAQALCKQVAQVLAEHPAGPTHFGTLYSQSLRITSLLAADPHEAVEAAQASLESDGYAYQQARSRSYLAAAYLRTGNHNAALKEITLAHQALTQAKQAAGPNERGDIGTLAWLKASEIKAHAAQNPNSSCDVLVSVLEDARFKGYQVDVLRVFGDALEHHEQVWLKHTALSELLELDAESFRMNLSRGYVRVTDLLVSRWLRVQGKRPLATPAP